MPSKERGKGVRVTWDGGVKENEEGWAWAEPEPQHKDLTTPAKAGDRRLKKSVKKKKNEGPQHGQRGGSGQSAEAVSVQRG